MPGESSQIVAELWWSDNIFSNNFNLGIDSRNIHHHHRAEHLKRPPILDEIVEGATMKNITSRYLQS